MPSPNTIVLKCNGLSERYDEATAAGAITPGHLIQMDSNGAVVVHATQWGGGEYMFAIEDSFQGRTIDNAYASGEKVRMHRAQLGDEIYAFLSPTGGTAAIGSVLSAKGDGTWQVTGAGTGALKVTSLEAIPQGTAAQRIRVRVGRW